MIDRVYIIIWLGDDSIIEVCNDKNKADKECERLNSKLTFKHKFAEALSGKRHKYIVETHNVSN